MTFESELSTSSSAPPARDAASFLSMKHSILWNDSWHVPGRSCCTSWSRKAAQLKCVQAMTLGG